MALILNCNSQCDPHNLNMGDTQIIILTFEHSLWTKKCSRVSKVPLLDVHLTHSFTQSWELESSTVCNIMDEVQYIKNYSIFRNINTYIIVLVEYPFY